MSAFSTLPPFDATMTSSVQSSGYSNVLEQDFRYQGVLWNAQPVIVQQFLFNQASKLADALVRGSSQTPFWLPEQVALVGLGSGQAKLFFIPENQREQLAGGLLNRLVRVDLLTALRNRLSELEDSDNQAVALGASLIRHATAKYLVHNLLPSGRPVVYVASAGDNIPTIPVSRDPEANSALMVEEDGPAREELLVPFVSAARRFYLPQWVAFDDQKNLLLNSVNDARACIASMQHFMEILNAAIVLAPYITADEDYLQKRYGMLGQLVNQGRVLASYEAHEIIHTLQRRAASKDLNRGLSLSFPYFDDQDLELKTLNFEVIPNGRIQFKPAFVTYAARLELAKVSQDTRLSPSTRIHLMADLRSLEYAFLPASGGK